jgi:hypothetical protein
MCGVETEKVEKILDELEALGVLSRDENGVIFNRRMAREGEISDMRSAAGKQGGRPRTKAKRKQTTKQNESKPQSKTKANPGEVVKANAKQPSRDGFAFDVFREENELTGAMTENDSEETKTGGVISQFPAILDLPEFRGIWASWIRFRSEIRKPLGESAIAAQLKRLASWAAAGGVPYVVDCVESSIANQYQGIFEPKGMRHGKPEHGTGNATGRGGNGRPLPPHITAGGRPESPESSTPF